MTRAFVVCLGLAATLLASCTPPPPTARIVVFTASDERIPRNQEVTVLWQAADAGVQDGLLSCVVTRRFGDDPTETQVPAACSGGLTEIPPAPLDATIVEYRFKVLKQPYDPADPYVTQARSVILDPALYAIRAGGTSADQARGVSTVPDGSAIVTGSFAGTATFGTTTLTSAGGADVFVARVHPDGTWAWATRAGGTGFDGELLAVGALPDGGAVVTGTFDGAATFGTTTLASAGGFSDVFVARIQPNGSWAWATRGGGPNTDAIHSVSVLPDGSAIVTGVFADTATFGTTTLTGVGFSNFDVFVARVQPDGTWAWATRAGGTGSDFANGVSALDDGGAIVTGTFAGTATYGTTTLTSAGDYEAFVARIDSDGTWVWATRAGGITEDFANGLGALQDGSAIVTGRFTGTATFGATTLTSAGSSDVFIARIEPNGTWAWATRAGGTSFDQASGVGTLADGSAIVTGTFNGTATFGATTLTSVGSSDAFVARIDPDGAWVWATRAGGTNSELPRAVSTLADGGAIVTGLFTGTATFGTAILVSAGDADVFVARIGADGAW